MAGPYRPKPSGFKPNGKKPNRPFPNQKKDENELNINHEISAPQVRLVGDNIPEPGIYPLAKALALADELELDLVEISAKADPPVCKILDYRARLPVQTEARPGVPPGRFQGKGHHLLQRTLHPVCRAGRKAAPALCGGT